MNQPRDDDRMVERPNRGSAANPFRTATKAYSDTTQKIEKNNLEFRHQLSEPVTIQNSIFYKNHSQGQNETQVQPDERRTKPIPS